MDKAAEVLQRALQRDPRLSFIAACQLLAKHDITLPPTTTRFGDLAQRLFSHPDGSFDCQAMIRALKSGATVASSIPLSGALTLRFDRITNISLAVYRTLFLRVMAPGVAPAPNLAADGIDPSVRRLVYEPARDEPVAQTPLARVAGTMAAWDNPQQSTCVVPWGFNLHPAHASVVVELWGQKNHADVFLGAHREPVALLMVGGADQRVAATFISQAGSAVAECRAAARVDLDRSKAPPKVGLGKILNGSAAAAASAAHEQIVAAAKKATASRTARAARELRISLLLWHR
jgi:hypothetical protein